MKQTLFILAVVAAIICGNAAHAWVPVAGASPDAILGVKAGANFEQLNGATWKQAYKPGIVIGAFCGLRKPNWGLRAEVLVNTAEYDLKDSLQTGAFRTVNLAIPVMFEYKLAKRIWVQAGPQFNALLNVTSSNGNYKDPKTYFNGSSVNLLAGLEARLPLHLVVGGRYLLGLTDLNNETLPGVSDAWKARSIQLYAGFRFM